MTPQTPHTTPSSAGSPTDEAQHTTSSSLMAEAQAHLHQVAEATQSTLHNVGETTRQKAAEVAAVTSDRVDAALTVTGEKLENLAHTLRDQAPAPVRELAQTAADKLEQSSHFLRDSDVQTLQQDVALLIQRHPFETFLAGVAAGYLLGRTLGRS